MFLFQKLDSYAFCIWTDNFDMLEVLVNEIKLLNLDSKNHSIEREKIDVLNKFLEEVCEKHPDLTETRPKADLLASHKKMVDRYILFLRKCYNRDQQDFHKRQAYLSSDWRKKDRKAVDKEEHSSRTNSSYGSNREVDANRYSWNQEGMRRGGFSARVDNQGCYGGGMRFDRSRQGMDSQRGNSINGRNGGEVGAMDVPDLRFDDGSKGSLRFHRDEGDTSCNQFRGEGRTTGNRRQFGNNSNRYDTTVTDWRSRSKE